MSEREVPHPWRIPGGEADPLPGRVIGSIAEVAEEDSRDAEVVEVTLLLPTRDAAALERAAWQRGLTTGQAVRRLITGFLCQTR